MVTIEFRIRAIVLTEKLEFDQTHEKIGVAASHFAILLPMATLLVL